MSRTQLHHKGVTKLLKGLNADGCFSLVQEAILHQ